MYFFSWQFFNFADNLANQLGNGFISWWCWLKKEGYEIVDKQKEAILKRIDELIGEFKHCFVDLAVFVLQKDHYLQIDGFHLVVIGNRLMEYFEAGQEMGIHNLWKTVNLNKQQQVSQRISQSLHLQAVHKLMLFVIGEQ